MIGFTMEVIYLLLSLLFFIHQKNEWEQHLLFFLYLFNISTS
jgi:hypothetical protein